MFALFDLKKIEHSLEEFRKDFARINNLLFNKRETFTIEMKENLLAAYAFLNELLSKDIDLFLPSGLHHLLELNHIVLCGTSTSKRNEYYHHLKETRKKFLDRIDKIKKWVIKHRSDEDAFKLAAGFYAKSLSKPQLFMEGNHRTGNIILNYLLLSKKAAPYIISRQTALDYLNLSGDIKFTDSENGFESTFKMPKYRNRFAEFLKTSVNQAYLIGNSS